MRRERGILVCVVVGALFLGAAAEKGARNKALLADAAARVYKKIGEVELRLYIYNPTGLKKGDKRPAIVFFHGGGFTGGNPSAFSRQCQHLASRGMVAITAQYRLKSANGTTPLESIKDGKSAMRWVRSNAKELGIDPNRIAAGGGSAGGMIALATALAKKHDNEGDDLKISCVPSALVLFNPGVFPKVDDKTREAKLAKFGDGFAQVVADLEPYNNLTKGAPPMIIFHGTADTTVPFDGVRRFEQKAKEMGVRCELVPYEGRPHAFFHKDPDYSDMLEKADAFLTSLGYLPPKAK